MVKVHTLRVPHTQLLAMEAAATRTAAMEAPVVLGEQVVQKGLVLTLVSRSRCQL